MWLNCLIALLIFSFSQSLPAKLNTEHSSCVENCGDKDMEDIQEWEKSGLFEGDILLPNNPNRNAIIQSTRLWSLPIPVYINSSEFNSNELNTIYNAMRELEKQSCVEFRKYKEYDKNFISVRGQNSGCWSVVGKKPGGQMLNLRPPKCVTWGIVLHEFLHALGLYHQQGSSDRDDFIKIHWENIAEGKEDNFRKYPSSTVTSFNLTYDYKSIMHYSSKAFSKNGQPTITPLVGNVTLGQRKQLSEKDILKINYLYNCAKIDSEDYSIEYFLGK